MKNHITILLLIGVLFIAGCRSLCCSRSLFYPRDYLADYEISVGENGSFTVSFGGESVDFESSFSYPGSPYGGNNKFGSSSSRWSVVVTPLIRPSYRITGTCSHYTVERNIWNDLGVIRVTDRITNTREEDLDLGIIIKHKMVNLRDKFIKEVYMGGGPARKQVIQGTKYSENPTIFIAFRNNGIGIMPEDDVFRVHAKSSWSLGGRRTGGTPDIELYDDEFVLPAGATYTLQWSIYPIRSSDYFDFINTVRQRNNLNFEIKGGFQFFYNNIRFVDWRNMATGTLGTSLQNLGVKYISAGILTKANGSFAHAHGSAFNTELGTVSETYLRELVGKIHAANDSTRGLDVKVLIYLSPYLSTETNATSTYSADRLLDENGTQCMVLEGKGTITTPVFYGHIDDEGNINPYGRTLLGTSTSDPTSYLYKALREFGADGIYLDNFHYCGYPTEKHYGTETWDGHSGSINITTYEIDRKFSYSALLTHRFRSELVRRVLEEYGSATMVANEPPITSTIGSYTIPHFQELGEYAKGHPIYTLITRKTHLSSPILLARLPEYYITMYNMQEIGGMVSQKERWRELITRDIREYLEEGNLFYYYGFIPYSDTADWIGGVDEIGEEYVISKMYPITPIELHSGYIIGQEKIITIKNGCFGWGDVCDFRVHFYNEVGKYVGENLAMYFRIRSSIGGGRIMRFAELTMPNGFIAIIERSP